MVSLARSALFLALALAAPLAFPATIDEDLQALDRLIELRQVRQLWNFASRISEPPPPEIEERIVRHFEDRAIATPLIRDLKGFRDPRLVEAMFADVERLAAWRAERRRQCRAVIWWAGHGAIPPEGLHSRVTSHGVRWSYVCEGGAPDDVHTDHDGRPKSAPFDREQASVAAIANAGVVGIERRLAPLLVDVAAYPAWDASRIRKGMTNLDFSPVRIPFTWLGMFWRRDYAPPLEQLHKLKALFPPPSIIPATDADTRQQAQKLDSLMRLAAELANGSRRPPDADARLLRAAAEEPGLIPALLEDRADAEAVAPNGENALSVACRRPVPLRVFRLMVERGADVNRATSIGQAPLHACARSCPQCITLLVSAGARPDRYDVVGRTPLAIALEVSNLATIEALLRAGADPNFQNGNGDSAFSLASYGPPRPEIVSLLEQHGGRLTMAQRARQVARRLDPRNLVPPD